VRISKVNNVTGKIEPIYHAKSSVSEIDQEKKLHFKNCVDEAKNVLLRPHITLHDIAKLDMYYTLELHDSLSTWEKWSVGLSLGIPEDIKIDTTIVEAMKVI
jgi:hypothetical protein